MLKRTNTLRGLNLENYKLDTVLETLKIAKKINVDHTKMRHAFNSYDEISHYIAYCVYDCVSLELLNKKKSLIQTISGFQQQLQLPQSIY